MTVARNGAWSRLLDSLLPAVCPLCEAPGAELCERCHSSLPVLHEPCPLCGEECLRPAAGPDRPALRLATCPACHGRGLPWIARTTVAWSYAGGIRHLVARSKINADQAAVSACCDLLPDPGGAAELVVAVPATPGRRPGPHLASRLGRALARRCGLPWQGRLLRQTRLAAEQHRLAQGDRQRNVAGLFQATGAVPDRVVLVDDLVTTGATASAAAAALGRAGARRVELVALARTPG